MYTSLSHEKFALQLSAADHFVSRPRAALSAATRVFHYDSTGTIFAVSCDVLSFMLASAVTA